MLRLDVPSDTEELVVMLVGEIPMSDNNKAIGGTLVFQATLRTLADA